MTVEAAAKLIISFGMVTTDKLPKAVRDKLPPDVAGTPDPAV